MALAVFGAVLAALLLEAEGLSVWAQRLEVGLLRERAVPAATSWHNAVQATGIDRARQHALRAKDEWAAWFAPASGLSVAIPSAVAAPVAAAPVASTPQTVVSAATASQAPNAPASVPTAVASSPAPAASAGAAPGDPLRVVLAGDSMMAVGLAPALTRGLSADKQVRLIRAYRSGTGLSRPEVFDWLVQYPQMVGREKPQLVICSMGANDAQNVQVGKQVLKFGTPEWDAFYTARLTGYMDMVTREQVRVLWIGMPVMRDAPFARKMSRMNELTRAVLSRYPTATWLDPNPSLGYASGTYEQYLRTERGRLVRLRGDDGIHVTDDGGLLLLPPVRSWLEASRNPAR